MIVWMISAITDITERNVATFNRPIRAFFMQYETRFAFSDNDDGKLTDNVAWYWLLDSNDGCRRGIPRTALSFTLYAKVGNLGTPSGTLWRHTLRTFSADKVQVDLPRCPALLVVMGCQALPIASDTCVWRTIRNTSNRIRYAKTAESLEVLEILKGIEVLEILRILEIL